MRTWIIEYFLGDVEDVSLMGEVMFYVIMAMPIIIAIATIILA